MADEMNRDVNSQDYWNERFELDWQSKSGGEQSRFFSQLAVDHLPSWFVDEVNGRRLSICDWGCAEGDGTELLAGYLPGAKVTGVDFAATGIKNASLAYPHLDFVCSDWLDSEEKPEQKYDVVFSSNTLEHFGAPWDIAERIARYCGRMLVFLIPFQEKERIDEHFYTFEFHNIRLLVGDDFFLSYSRVIESGECVPSYWRGRQLLLIFLRRRDPLWSSLTLENTVLASSLEDRRILDALRRGRELEAKLKAQRDELEARMQSRLEAQRAEMEAQMKTEREKLEGEKSPQAQDLKARMQSQLETQRAEMEAQMKTQRAEMEAQMKTEREKLEGEKSSQAQELKRVRATVEELMHSSSWRLTAPMRWAAETLRRLRRSRRSGVTPTESAAPVAAAFSQLPLQVKRSPPKQMKEFRVAAILDTFTESCFAPECELIEFRPDNWQELLTENPPDLLFVESAWNGNDGAWQYRVAEYHSPPGRELLDLLAWCKKAEIPTVFWNKEDPPHFDDFIESACRFDWIFTTDANCIPRYRERCGHDRIHALPFAAQPEIHNPVLKEPRNDKVCFAGTYYGDRFDARRDAMETLLRPALDFDLDIYDRMHGAVGPGTENYRFPQEYVPHIVGRLEYKDMVEAYRRYRVFLNVNSVSDSKTMFSRRVFELLACGTPVVSTESQGIRDMFPSIVPIATDGDEARAAIAELLTDDRSWRRRSALGIRRVMQAHTYSHRLRQLLEMVGFELDSADEARLTVVVRPGPNPEATASQLMAQTRAPNRVVLLRNPHSDALAGALERTGMIAPVILTDRLSDLTERETGIIVAFIDGTHTYGPNYLEDSILALDYSHARSTSMTAHFELSDDGSTDFVTDLGEANLMSRRVMHACFVCGADLLPPGFLDSVFSKDLLELDTDCYARSPFEFVAGAALEPTDPRVSEALLEETTGVQRT